MKKTLKLLAVLLAICAIVCAFASCNKEEEPTHVDYAAAVKLDMNSSTLKLDVTGKVKLYIDGDTTHFYVPKSDDHPEGVLKARYLAVNTPESTGKIEVWGKTASNFTKSKLSSATSIIIESDTNKWDADSTGSRFLVWVWYKTADSEDYRNLNLEILQEGLAIASNSAQNRYGQLCVDAIAQAKVYGYNVHSKTPDPDFFYGQAVPVTISELRANIESYNGTKVAFEGVITRDSSNGVYVEAYDDETGMYNGIYVYYGFNLSGAGLEILSVGNKVLIVGTVSYYETGDSYQVSGLQYRARVPDDPNNIQKISDGHLPAYTETTAAQFTSKVERVVVEDGEEVLKEFEYSKLCLGTSISMKNLKVVRIYTTTNEESSSKGAMTITCTVDGITIDVRTTVIYDENGALVTEQYFNGKTIDVKGIIDAYQGESQIKVFAFSDITIH